MKTTNLGFPNSYDLAIKKAVEGFWKGTKTIQDIERAQEEVSAYNLRVQSGLDLVPVFDFDIYDRFLKTAVLFSFVPERFGSPEEAFRDTSVYLSIPRGTPHAEASPMVKWFNTNYHVVQAEIEREPKLQSAFKEQLPDLSDPRKKFALIGPWTLLSFSLNTTSQSNDDLFEKLIGEYVQLIHALPEHTVVQLEEPSFVTHGVPHGYGEFLSRLSRRVHLHVYFGEVNDFAQELFSFPAQGIGLDFVDGSKNIDLLQDFPKDKELIAGVINGRNVWPVSTRAEELLKHIQQYISDEKLYISPSCSLLHVPLTAGERAHQFSFALEKIEELGAIQNGSVVYRSANIQDEHLPARRFERSRVGYWISEVPYPTTTIGSYPQLPELRKTRRQWRKGELSGEEYEQYIKRYIKECVSRQEDLGLDVLVHGEPERADMVQFFAEHFDGFDPETGFVQSYGTRYTKPPVITGPVSRPDPFTVKWITYAQSLTSKPVKGMLTGPVTIVQWSFPREDVSREYQYYDVARALAEEVKDLVRAGTENIQIDEPAIREGLPLDLSRREHYLFHAVNAFRLVYASVPDNVVVHSHMCFSEFPEIIEAIRDMGVDVLSIEDSKAKGKTAVSIREGGFPGSIGLGVFDVHSPRIPKVDEMLTIPSSLDIDPRRIWINPDCGLKTRGIEAYEQLGKMMEVVKILRGRIQQSSGQKVNEAILGYV